MLAEKQFRETEEMKAKAQISHAQPDDLIDFYHLKSRRVRKKMLTYCCFLHYGTTLSLSSSYCS
jgi:hypothetical protein